MKLLVNTFLFASLVTFSLGQANAEQPLDTSVVALAPLMPYLPSELAVKGALLSSPLMQAARSKKEAVTARAKGIDSCAAEFTLRSTSQHRREVAAGTKLHESMVSIERPVRFWGKRGIDADLATHTQAFADI